MSEPGETFKAWLISKGAGAYEEALKECTPSITTVLELAKSNPDILKKCGIDPYIAKQTIDHATIDGVALGLIPQHAAVKRAMSGRGGHHKKSRRHKCKSTRKRSKTSKRTRKH